MLCVLPRAECKFKIAQLHNLAQRGSTWILPLRRLPKTPTKSHLEQTSQPSFAFLPTSWETHSWRELPPESLIEKAPASGLSAQELRVPIFKVQLATLARYLWLPFLPREIGNCLKSCEESWSLITAPPAPKGRRKRLESSPHQSHQSQRVFFAFHLFCVSLWF